jgi:hypothetical protein
MSLYYTHLLIPLSPEYRPEPGAVAAFGQGIIDNGNAPNPFKISFSKVTKGQPNVRGVRNMVTGETIGIRGPSRRGDQPHTLSSTSQIIESAADQREYDISIYGEGVPSSPPFPVGYVEDNTWKPLVGAYHLEIRCRIRINIVRLFMLKSEEELHQPPDIAKWQPRLDEDCSVDEREGIFVHPEVGAIRIKNAGCGTFWIEFKYGKFVFPRLRNGSVNVLNDSILTLARKSFGCDFMQACNWG